MFSIRVFIVKVNKLYDTTFITLKSLLKVLPISVFNIFFSLHKVSQKSSGFMLLISTMYILMHKFMFNKHEKL